MADRALLPTDSRSEKPARGAAFTALTRNLGKDTIVIMDGMNYIKGFRYQMHCAGREAQVRMCTVSPASFAPVMVTRMA